MLWLNILNEYVCNLLIGDGQNKFKQAKEKKTVMGKN